MVEIPHVDVERASGDLRKLYEMAPYPETILSIVAGLEAYMKKVIWAREKIEIYEPQLSKELEAWNLAFLDFALRIPEYKAAADGAADAEDLQKYAYDPLFKGIYPEDMTLEGAPEWPDIETPWRLMNDLSVMAGEVVPQEVHDEVKEDYDEVIVTFLTTTAKDLGEWAKDPELPKGVRDIYDEASGYVGGLTDDVEKYVEKKTKEKVTAAVKKGLLIAGVGVVALLAISRASRTPR